jgi:hypothetical protein
MAQLEPFPPDLYISSSPGIWTFGAILGRLKCPGNRI